MLFFRREAPPSGEFAPAKGVRPRYIVIGNSHTLALTRAAREAGRIDILIRNLYPDRHWHNSVRRYARRLGRSTPCFSLIGGNFHNSFGMVEHPDRFDFIEPDSAETEIAQDRKLVPYDVMRARFRQSLEAMLDKVKNLREEFTGPVHHVLPPPPLADNDFIAANYGPFFREKKDVALGVAPSTLRKKLFRLHNDVFEEFCADIGVPVLAHPTGTSNRSGFLKRRYWRNDATHANTDYGELVLEQMDAIVASGT